MSDGNTPVKDIELLRPITPYAGQPPLTTVRLKEPTGGLYSKLGEPRLIVRSGKDGAYFVEQPATIEAYLNACIDHEQGALIVAQLSLADAMRVKLGLFDFFVTAEAEALSK